MQDDNPLSKVDAKEKDTIRFISFNINGIKTLNNYYPWNQYSNSFNNIFHSLHGDVVSLQELKLTSGNLSSVNIANLTDYRSFISLPSQKKGYSGVGLFVRIPRQEEMDSVKHSLNVVKAEEGITGLLKASGVRYIDMDPTDAIGGYIHPNTDTASDIQADIQADTQTDTQVNTDVDPKKDNGVKTYTQEQLMKLDSEGRAVVVELASGVVVFSLYCPANSMGTEEGEEFKDSFMDILIRRCQKLVEAGKQVLILGDINVSLHLIDQAEGIHERLNKKLITYINNGEAFESLNPTQCLSFKLERYSRFHLNQFVTQDITDEMKDHFHPNKQFLYDTTRLKQKKKLGLYTCWNTLNGARQTNFGSRIDLILTTKAWSDKVVNASTWPFLMGSDHCPIFTDFQVEEVENQVISKVKLKFEARSFYNLGKHRDISSMFQSSKKRKADEASSQENTKQRKQEGDKHKENSIKLKPSLSAPSQYKSRKPKASQTSIGNFFRSKSLEAEQLEIEREIQKSIQSNSDNKDSISDNDVRTVKTVNIMSIYGEPPKCEHGVACQLKTSLNNPKTRGRKFWCCSIFGKGLGNGLSEGRCDYFQWLKDKSNE